MKLIFALLILIIISPNIYAGELGDVCGKYNVKYIAGVDIDGNKVVSADINDNTNILLDPIIIPLRVDIAERFDLDLTEGAIAEPIVSNIEIYQDGRVKYNGKYIDVSVEQLCKFHEESENNIIQEHGQEASYPVISSDKNN